MCDRRRREPRVIVFIPAHNEQATIADTLYAVLTQSRRPDEVVLVADNCSDLTEQIALELGVTVMRTIDNPHKKAGALNQAVDRWLPRLHDNDVVAGFDADTIPDRDFLLNALKHHDRGLGAVGAVFSGRKGAGLIGLFQRTEYARFGHEQGKRQRTNVLSGTGWTYTARSMRAVIEARRDGRLPCAETPEFWFTGAITEDFEATLAMLAVGVRMASPPDCTVVTDVMPTIGTLWTQRMRWQQGTLESLRLYGWQRFTRRMIASQLLIYTMMLLTPTFVCYEAIAYLEGGTRAMLGFSPLWSGLGLLLIAEKVWRTRHAGRAGLLLSALVLPEWLFDCGRQLVYIKALFNYLRGHKVAWGAGHDI